MSFHIVNLGCKVNRVESDAIASALLKRGFASTSLTDANLVVVNTCTVTGEAEKKTRKAVRHALRMNEQGSVVVTGCAAAIDPDTYRSMSERVHVVSKPDFLLAVQDGPHGAPLAYSAEDDARSFGQASGAESFEQLPFGAGFRSRVGVKVQDGCDNACTYCIVHVARGRATSRPAHEVIEECERLARAGAHEIVLTGINLGSYRDGAKSDPSAVRLADLLRLLLNRTASLHAPGEPPVRFRISSIEPRDVDDSLIELIASSEGRLCRHLHLPLQSGSTAVLREMARPYTAEFFADLVSRMRAAIPELSLSTDCIVGFPGESEAQFAETMALARACAFSKIHVFPYSRREGTPAARRSDQIDPAIKSRRAAQLRALSEELRARDFDRRIGTEELVLVEDGLRATTESYHEIIVADTLPAGALVPIVLTASMRADDGAR